MRSITTSLALGTALALGACSHGGQSNKQASAGASGMTQAGGSTAPSCPVAIPNTTVSEEDTPNGAALVFATRQDQDVWTLQQAVQHMADRHNQMHARGSGSSTGGSAGFGAGSGPASDIAPPSPGSGSSPETGSGSSAGDLGTTPDTGSSGRSGMSGSSESSPASPSDTGSPRDNPPSQDSGGYGTPPSSAPSAPGEGGSTGSSNEQSGSDQSGSSSGAAAGSTGSHGTETGGTGSEAGTGDTMHGRGRMAPMMGAVAHAENTPNGARLEYSESDASAISPLRQAVRMRAEQMQNGKCPMMGH